MEDSEFGGAGDGEVVGIEGDVFCVVVDAKCGDDEVEGTGIEPGGAALLAEAGGITPDVCRSEEHTSELQSQPW